MTYILIYKICSVSSLKEKILRAVSHRNSQLINKGKNDLTSKIEMKLAKLTVDAIWTANLIKTSLTITRTPATTLRSIIKSSLNVKNGKKSYSEDNLEISKSKNIQPIPFQAMSAIQRLI